MDTFKQYEDSGTVCDTYKTILANQTLEYVTRMKRRAANVTLDMWSALHLLNLIVDESDPDIDVPQIYHCYQAAEAMRTFLEPGTSTLRRDLTVASLFDEAGWARLPAHVRAAYPRFLHELYPHIDDFEWLQVVGFVHDAGKVMVLPNFGGLPQWSAVGDTFPVGCKLDSSYVYSEHHSANADFGKYDECGIYAPHCGLDALHMSYGHDEYLARTLDLNEDGVALPAEAKYIIRFHSFYAWHASYAYAHLASEYDWKMLPLVKMFQKCDLYSKTNETATLDIGALEPVYKSLILKYFKKPIRW